MFARRFAVSALLAAVGATGTSTLPGHPDFSDKTNVQFARLDDRCTDQPGYANFRRALTEVVARQDAAAFDHLFAASGSMRVNGLSRYSGPADRRWHSPEAAQVWRQLRDILSLGCAIDGARLYLPPVGALAEKGLVGGQSDFALLATAIRQRPAASARVVRRLRRGEIVQRIAHDTPEGWNEVQVGATSGFIRAADVRSTHDLMLVLIREGTRLKIGEFFGGV